MQDQGCAPAGKLLILLDPELGHATAQVRGLIHQPMFKKYGWTAEYFNVRKASESELVSLATHFDFVYLLKVASLSLVQNLKAQTKAKIVFDLSDTLWKPVHRAVGWQDLESILRTVDCIFSENEFIAEYGRQFNRTHLVPPMSNAEGFDDMRRYLPARSDGRVRLGWIGSTGTAAGLAGIAPALRTLCQNHPEVDLRIVGCADPERLAPLAGLPVQVVPQYDERAMLREILQMDIGLYPPPIDLEDYMYRGPLKALLYMQGEVPPVCLNYGDCAKLIQDGVNGMLVNQPEDWVTKTEALINSPELRRSMGKRAAESVRPNHNHEVVFKQLAEGFRSLRQPA